MVDSSKPKGLAAMFEFSQSGVNTEGPLKKAAPKKLAPNPFE